MKDEDELSQKKSSLYAEAAHKRAPIFSNSYILPDADYRKQHEKYHARACLGGVVGIILSPEQKIILVHRSKSLSGWALPGGLVEHNENFLAAFQREILEEIGARVTNVGLLMVEEKTFISSSTQDQYPFLLGVYTARIEQNILPPPTQEAKSEGLSAEVFDLDNLPSRMILADREKIEYFLKGYTTQSE